MKKHPKCPRCGFEAPLAQAFSGHCLPCFNAERCDRCGNSFSSPLVHFDWEGKRYCEHCSCEIVKDGGCLIRERHMPSDGKIKENDIVSVNFNSIQYTLVKRGIVHHVPCDVGDGWHIEDLSTGDILHISEGCTVRKKANPKVRI